MYQQLLSRLYHLLHFHAIKIQKKKTISTPLITTNDTAVVIIIMIMSIDIVITGDHSSIAHRYSDITSHWSCLLAVNCRSLLVRLEINIFTSIRFLIVVAAVAAAAATAAAAAATAAAAAAVTVIVIVLSAYPRAWAPPSDKTHVSFVYIASEASVTSAYVAGGT